MWGEQDHPELPPETPGHSRLILHHWDLEGAPMGPPLELATTSFSYGPALSAVALAHPRSVLVSWAAREEATAPRDITFLARLDCNETP